MLYQSTHPRHVSSILPFIIKVCTFLASIAVYHSVFAQPVITEFMASNDETLQDDDGEYSDWLEIHNPGSEALSLANWYLTDDEDEKTKWQFPAVTLDAGEYLVVFASSEDRTDPGAPLHTNFGLSAGGEYLGLIQPDGVTVVSEFAPEYPEQTEDISYGVTQSTDDNETPQIGYFAEPTPGATNGGPEALLILDEVIFSRTSGPFFNDTTLILTGASEGQVIHYKVSPPAEEGADFDDPTSDDPLYVEPVSLTESVVVRAAIFSADGQQHGPMSTHHFMRVDTSSADRVDTFSSQMPLIVFDNHGFGPMEIEDKDHPAWLYTFWNEPGSMTTITETPDVVSGLELEVRGQTSSGFPKKSYKFDMTDHFGSKIEQSLTGRAEFNEWAVIGPWGYDRSFIRNAFTYGLSNSMGRWAADSRLVEAFFNADGDALELSDYAGVYVITDQLEVESNRLDIEELSGSDNSGEDLTGGYVLEIDEPDEDKYSWETDNGSPGIFTSVLLVDSPKVDDITSEQIDYITTYVQDMEDALIAGEDQGWSNHAYLQYLDRSSWIDYHLINTFVKNVDFYWRGSKFYKDRNERLMAGPVWDFDRSLGSADPRDNEPTEWNAPGNTDQGFGVQYWSVGWFGRLAQDPEFMQGWFDRWQQLRATSFSTQSLHDRITGLAEQIGAAAASRDVAQWPDNLSEQGSYSAEIDYMKDWLSQRAGWIDGMLVYPPTVVANPDGSTTVTPITGSELVYTLDGGDPRLRGGAIAPDALRSSESVTFPAGSTFRARGYNQFLGAWPGTKWSRALPGDIGAPYQAATRLVNLSSRAHVGSGENVVVSGLVINDADQKWVLFRGIGPTLADFGVTDPLADPVLTIMDADGEVVAQNSGWSSDDNAEDIADISERVGAFPLEEDSGDAALLVHLPVGRYTVHLASAGGTGGTALTEAYEIDDIGSLLNISIRGRVNDADTPLIAGFVVTGDQAKRVLVRGIGPSLANHGVETPLANPHLQIESGGEVIAQNEDWEDTDPDLITAANLLVGAFELDAASTDAAMLVTLQPGIYTAIVSGAEDTAGTALVEVYELE